ncbi:MAG: class I SAM-dependent methyltransferase [Ruminococcus sp.]|nr:class I SAM-dependent methyltransferase [Ruminococcus sp.]
MKRCIVCGEALGRDGFLLTLTNQPSGAQNIPLQDELTQDNGMDLPMIQCSACGLIQLECEPVPYFRDTIRAGGVSTTAAQLRREQYRHFIDLCGLKGKKIVEVGCGQGEFLDILSEFPVDAYGIEHKPELVEIGRKKGLNISSGFTETADTVIEGAPFDAFLSFNFIEHQPAPNTMLRCIYRNLTENGCGLITAPSMDYILHHSSYYELMRDHIAYYSEETLRFLLNRNGFTVIESTTVNRDTLSMIVKKRSMTDVSGLTAVRSSLSDALGKYVSSRQQKGSKIAVWGASHQAFAALSTADISQEIAYIIDSAPFKQGRYSPATHIPIVAPNAYFEDPVDCILIIAPGYTNEIADVIRDKFGHSVEIAAIRTDSIELL